MRFLSQGEYALSRFSPPMKVALSFFLLFVLLGLLSSLALYHQQFDLRAERAAEYYLGNQGDPNPEVMLVQKSYRQLLEVTHFHLFIMPVVYLALTHLYFLAPRRRGEKLTVTILAFGGLLAEVGLPWLIRFGSAGWAPLFWVSGGAITGSTLWMCGVCFGELWMRSTEGSST